MNRSADSNDTERPQHGRHGQLLVLSLLLVVLFALGIPGLSANANYRAYFDTTDPLLKESKRIEKDFKQFDSLVIGLDFGGVDALSQEALQLLAELTGAVQTLPQVLRVSSVLDIDDSSGFDQDEPLADLFADESDEAVQIDTRVVESDPRGIGVTVSTDRHALLLDVAIALPEQLSAAAVSDLMEQLRAIVDQLIADSPLAATARYTGTLALNEAYVNVVRHDLGLYLPIAALALLALLKLSFGSISLGLKMLLVPGLAVIGGFGTAGWLSLQLAAIDAFAPVIIASLSLAGAVHLVGSYARALASGAHQAEALAQSVTENQLPLALTSLTTAAGFLALLVSPSPPVRVMGWIVASGVLFSWFLNAVFMPALLARYPEVPGGAYLRLHKLVSRTGVRKQRPALVAVGFGIALVAACSLTLDNEISDNVFEYFPADHQFRADMSWFDDRFSGINRISYALDSGRDHGVFDRKFIDRLRAFEKWALAQPEVRHVVSLTSLDRVRKRLAALNEDGDPGTELERLSARARLTSPAGLGVEQLVSPGFQSMAVQLYLKPLPGSALTAFDERARQQLTMTDKSMEAFSGGPSLAFAKLGARNADAMISAFIVALFLVAAISALAFSSVHASWIGLLCNAFPILLIYGIWSLIDGQISMGAAVVLGMILGIVVDDSLYLLARFAHCRRQGEREAASSTVHAVGPSIVITSVCLCCGLATGLLSDFAPIAIMSGLSVAVIWAALLTDLVALPALLRLSHTAHKPIVVEKGNSHA